MGQRLIYVPECHSTNSALIDLTNHKELPEGTVLITDHQSKGRGQRGNAWETKKGENLTFSMLLKPKFLAPKDQFQLNMAIALGVAAGLEDLVTRTISLKWPNDIFIEDKKVGGILIENQSQGTSLSLSIVGLGLNVNQVGFPFPNAGSLIDFTGVASDLSDLFGRLMSTVEACYLDLRAGNTESIRKSYLLSLYRFNKPHSFEAFGKHFIGTITDVDEFGRLCIQTEEETRKFSLKEIRMIHSMN